MLRTVGHDFPRLAADQTGLDFQFQHIPERLQHVSPELFAGRRHAVERLDDVDGGLQSIFEGGDVCSRGHGFSSFDVCFRRRAVSRNKMRKARVV